MVLEGVELDLGKIAESGQCFRWQRLGEAYYRIPHGGDCLYIRREGPGRFDLDCDEAAFEALWRPYFDLDTDYAAINGAISPRDDPFLCAAMEDQRGVRVLRQDLWEMLVTSIITQNRNIPAIRRSVELLSQLGGSPMTDRAGREYHAFPTPGQLLDMGGALGACKLGYREAYVRRAAEAVCEGALDLEGLRRMPDEACRRALVGLYGVGDKVAACVMLFGMHRLNAFPRDVWMNRVLAERYPTGYPFERYAPNNGVYQQYLFAYYRSLDGVGKT